MENLLQIVGPPGTGKTGQLTKIAKEESQGMGGVKSVMICSLTRAAAHEISKRNSSVHKDMIGTLHAHAYRALGAPDIAEASIDDWNEEFPHYQLKTSKKGSKKKPSLDDLGGDEFGETHGDQMLALANNLRAKCIERELWRDDVREFFEVWDEWKQANGLLDFTDLIEVCLSDVEKAPGDPSTMLGDEAQDWSALEVKLFRDKWGKHATTVVMAGDFDQTLYEWRGADPETFLKTHQKSKILEQSYRVPKQVHKTAVDWIEQIETREKVVYHPTDQEGSVRQLSVGYRSPSRCIDDIEMKIAEGKTCMILCSCAYMLKSVVFELRQRAIPFSNPYRKTNGSWNPLLRRKNATMPIDRVTSFLAPHLYDDPWRLKNQCRWTMDELKNAITVLQTKGMLTGGVKSCFHDMAIAPKTFTELSERFFLHQEDCFKFIEGDLDWYEEKLLESKKRVMSYPIEIAKRHGPEVLKDSPKVIVGTIHSVKGGEADVVYLFPDLSLAGMQEYTGGERGFNSVVRTFYVGMTRAKEELVLCRPSGATTVRWIN